MLYIGSNARLVEDKSKETFIMQVQAQLDNVGPDSDIYMRLRKEASRGMPPARALQMFVGLLTSVKGGMLRRARTNVEYRSDLQ